MDNSKASELSDTQIAAWRLEPFEEVFQSLSVLWRGRPPFDLQSSFCDWSLLWLEGSAISAQGLVPESRVNLCHEGRSTNVGGAT